MNRCTRSVVLAAIVVIAAPSALSAHPATDARQSIEREAGAGVQLAQVSQSPGPGPVTPDGSPYVNVDPYANLRNYTPPPNTNFRPPSGCSGDMATVSQNLQDAYNEYTLANKSGQRTEIIQQQYNKYVQIHAQWECLRAAANANPNPSNERLRSSQ